MPKKFRPITKDEKVKQIGVGLFIAFIFAIPLGFIAPFLFQFLTGFFDQTPTALRDCNLSDFRDSPIKDYIECKENSNSFEWKMERLSHKIPWFWVAFIFFSWMYTRNAIKGRIRDDSEDLIYDGQGGMDFLLMLIGHFMFYICLWVVFIRSKNSFIALGVGVLAILMWYVLNKWLLKTYGRTKAERHAS